MIMLPSSAQHMSPTVIYNHLKNAKTKKPHLMKTLEEKCKDSLTKLIESLQKPGEDSVTQYLSTLHPNFRGFGTTSGERITSKEELRPGLREAFNLVPGGFFHEIKWIEFKQINDTTGELFAEMTLRLGAERGVILYDLIRISATLQKVGEIALFTHFHWSVPELGATNDELFPGSSKPKIYDEVSILFTDFIDFTKIASKINPQKLVKELNDIFSNFDKIIRTNQLIKIKTIGDAYMAAAGISERKKEHASSTIFAAYQMLEFLKERNLNSETKWKMRVGIHSGSVIGGTIALDKFQFDLWGDTVNSAARMESNGENDRINISQSTYNLIKENSCFSFIPRGKIQVKNNGKINMYFVEVINSN